MAISEIRSLFDTARKAYPGIKRGLSPEWDYLQVVCRKHKLDLKRTVSEITVGVSRLLLWRNRAEIEKAAGVNILVPFPKNFKTWLYNRCWTEEFPEIPHRKSRTEILDEKRAAYKKAKDG